MKRLTHDDVVGTEQGYQHHIRRKTEPCAPCREAHARDYQRARDRRNPHRSVRVPLAAIAAVLNLVPTTKRGAAAALLGDIGRRADELDPTTGDGS